MANSKSLISNVKGGGAQCLRIILTPAWCFLYFAQCFETAVVHIRMQKFYITEGWDFKRQRISRALRNDHALPVNF